MTRLAVLLAVLCAPAQAQTLELRTSWHNVAEPEVYVMQPHETRTEALSAWRPEIERRVPASAASFTKIERYQSRAALGFWVGVVGMAVSIYYYEQHVPRTIGNAVWGAGWLGWLGYGALTTAELEDVNDLMARKAAP